MDANLPQCIGIILDGNRRWAKERGMPSLEGHRRGMDRLAEAVRWVRDRGIPHLVVYAFSTENWNRTEEEVLYLMDLFRSMTEKQLSELAKEGVCIRFVGQRERFDERLRDLMRRAEETSIKNEKITLWVCLSYGGRAEIADAARAAAAAGEVTEDSLAAHLWTAGMPDPDVVIRPGGEKRLSNFLPWQSVYSELFFIREYWPDFSETLLDAILTEYGTRERRNGK